MKKFLPSLVATIAVLILSSVGSLAQNRFFVVTNNDPPSANSATIFELNGSKLDIFKSLTTGGSGGGGGPFNLIRIVVAETGSSQCLFIGDAGSSDIASYLLPVLKKVGNYTDPKGNSSGFGFSMGLATRGNLLFAGYGVSANIGVFQIGDGCKLTLLGTYDSVTSVAGMRVSPDGQTLVVGYGFGENQVDSYSISSTGVLTEHGPYPSLNGAAGVDITSDGRYAVFGDATGGPTQIEVYPINSDGTLGAETSFGGDGSLGNGVDSSSVWLSPNLKFLFVANNLSKQVTSLGFAESPLKISFVSTTTLQDQSNIISIGGLTTLSPAGNGGALYVAEFSGNGLVGLLKINADGTLTESPSSPFDNGTASSLESLAAYPPRTF